MSFERRTFVDVFRARNRRLFIVSGGGAAVAVVEGWRCGLSARVQQLLLLLLLLLQLPGAVIVVAAAVCTSVAGFPYWLI